MRIPTLLIVVGALTVAPLALAAPASSPDGAGAMPVQVICAPTARLSQEEFDGVHGEYDLSDGRRLTVSSNNRKLYAKVGAQKKIELVAVGRAAFVGRDAALRIEFDQLPFASRVRVIEEAS